MILSVHIFMNVSKLCLNQEEDVEQRRRERIRQKGDEEEEEAEGEDLTGGN